MSQLHITMNLDLCTHISTFTHPFPPPSLGVLPCVAKWPVMVGLPILLEHLVALRCPFHLAGLVPLGALDQIWLSVDLDVVPLRRVEENLCAAMYPLATEAIAISVPAVHECVPMLFSTARLYVAGLLIQVEAVFSIVLHARFAIPRRPLGTMVRLESPIRRPASHPRWLCCWRHYLSSCASRKICSKPLSLPPRRLCH
jgi:hypothetical protein